MLKIDNKSKCTIFAGSFFDDLDKYTLKETDKDLKLMFDGGVENAVTFNLTALHTVIQSGLNLEPSASLLTDNWIPIFIDNDDQVISKEIRKNFTIKKKILGIENFIQFKGLFKNWLLSNDTKLNSNWFINSNDISYIMDYGVLCWYKKNTQYLYDQFKQLDEFPIGSRVLCDQALTAKLSDSKSISISTTDVLIKHSKHSLIIADKDDSKFNSTTDATSTSANISFNTERRIFDLSKVQNIDTLNPKFKSHINSIDQSNDLLKHSSLWIANGEAYSYSLNKNRRAENYSLNTPTLSYLSPSLFYIYTAVYHRLTVRQIKNANTASLSQPKLAMLKKLAYFLSTAPLIDRTTVDLLYHDDIQTYVDTLLNATINNQNIEKQLLLLTLINIMKKFELLSTKLRTYSNLAVNIINNKTDLFNKIVNKYCPHLLIRTDTDVSYKHDISYGPNISVRRNIRSSCSKSLVNQQNSGNNGIWPNTVFYNEDIKCHGYSISTNFGPNHSEIVLAPNNIIPTADIVRSPLGGDTKLDLGPPIKVSMDTAVGGELSFFVDFEYNPNKNIRDIVFWELVDGPDCLRFSNCRSDPNIFGNCAYTKRLRTSTDDSPRVYIKSRGLYTIKATVDYGFDKQTDILRIYVVDSSGEYGPGLKPPANVLDAKQVNQSEPVNYYGTSTFDSNLVSTDYLKCLCLNMFQFGLSKTNALFWPVKTDSYIIQTGFEQVLGGTIEFNVPGMVRLEEFLFSGAKTDAPDSKLTFTIKPGQYSTDSQERTSVLWENIYLQHMRSEHPECAQCESFFQDVLGRTPKRITQKTYGTSGFDRRRRTPDGASLKKLKPKDESYDGVISWDNESYENLYPAVSLKYAPKIKAYGGYDLSVLQNIGVTEIPDHPPISGELPVLQQRHFFGYPEDINCYLKPLYISNSGDISFDKGTFHPASGWICSTASSDPKLLGFSDSSVYTNDIMNKDSSLKFKTDKLETFIFKGLGIYGLRSSASINATGISIDPLVKNSYIRLYSASDEQSFQNVKDMENHQYGYRAINGPGVEEDQFYSDIGEFSTSEFDCAQSLGASYAIDRTDIDDLVIESLEIKINNLNYPNTKHIVAWLEVTNDSLSSTTPDRIQTNFTQPNAITNTDLQQYVTALQQMNSPPDTKTRKLYLLNRDSLDNFIYNFSIQFSDDTKNIVGFNYSTIPIPNTVEYPETLVSDKPSVAFNNQKIKPTLTAHGYNDIDCTKFKEAIVKNKLFDQNNTFAKFNGIPLKNTKFTLYIGIYDDTDNLTIRDATYLNNALLGVTSVVSRQKPNILTNAFCSWDLIIHTKKVEKPVPSDPIGIFDRKSDKPVFDRCNFIANFKDKKYLIPQVNLNAPYQYIDGINSCKYKDEELSTFTRFNTVEFPTWAILQIIDAMTPIYGGGGFVFTGDPSTGYNAIYEYFGDIRLENQSEIQRRKVQTGRYTDFGLGRPDKALINISQDGFVWYKLEVPIYRYSNSTILQKNKYQYIKISKDIMPFLSRFQYSLFNDSDKPFLKQNVGGNDPWSINSTYYWRKNNISGFDSNTLPSVDVVFDTTPGVSSSISKRYIKIKGTRAYYLFDKNETVFISKPTKDDPDAGFSPTILGKGILNLNDMDYTVFYMSQDIDTTTYIAKNQKDTIVIFKNDYSTVGENNPFNKWGLDKSPNPKKVPDRSFNTLGEGSYGRGTEYVRESVFSSLEDSNTIEPIYNILNHKINPNYKFNKITIYKNDGSTYDIDPSANSSISTEQTIRGYPWSLTADQKGFLQNYILYGEISSSLKIRLKNMTKQKEEINTNKDLTKEQKIRQLRDVDKQIPISEVEKMFIPDLKAYLSFIEPDADDCTDTDDCLKVKVQDLLTKKETEISIFYSSNHEYTFMDIKCSSFDSDSVPDSGEVVIENDWIIDQPKNKLSDTDITTIKNRITFLKTKTDSFEQEVKNAVNNKTNIPIHRLKAVSVPDLIFYLNSINQPDKQPDCYQKASYTDELCRQAFTKRLISDREAESTELQYAVETNNRYSKGILPIVERTLETKKDGVLNIKETLNTDYYWITIDPEQECSLSKNMTAKVLSRTFYHCVPNKARGDLAGYYTSDVAQVCPHRRKDVNGKDVSATIGVGNMNITNYKKEQEKSRYPISGGWQTLSYSTSDPNRADKYIWINGGSTDTVYPNIESLISIAEEFEIPSSARIYGKMKVKDVIDIKNLNTIKIRFGNIPRKVKEYDRQYRRYVPNFWAKLGKGFPSQGDGGDHWYSFDCWTCFNSQGEYVALPDQYKVMNEMLFRAYFGSVDGIEHKNSLLSDTKQSWEWIPYEYDKDANKDY